jgi:hypothetical protein
MDMGITAALKNTYNYLLTKDIISCHENLDSVKRALEDAG